jgi:YidC/Oxa1 family membrane protein insertase
MTLFDYLFIVLIEPLKLLFEVVFYYSYKFSGNVALSIVVISLVINLLVLPLYKYAEKLEKEQRKKKQSIKPWADRIKASFKGDERVMMLQAYYRENDYKVTSVFKESVSLFLQIPFFMAAYSFLSELKILQGVSLGPIADLASPDSLISIGAFSINALPILMTLINIVSSFIYSEKGNIRDKIKLVLIALIFLVLLYNSPAGLVFYWTLNNIFSLGKNIVMHFRKSKPEAELNKVTFKFEKRSLAVIMLSCVSLAVLTGVMIPSDVVFQSPFEMTNTLSYDPHSPLLYLLVSAFIAIGVFLIWIPVFICFSNARAKLFASYFLPCITIASVINYFVFNKNFGLLSHKLIYNYDMRFDLKEILINLLVDLAVVLTVLFLSVKFKKIIKHLMAVVLLAICMISAVRVIAIVITLSGFNYMYRNTSEDVNIELSATGQNVVVIMLDKMTGSYIPYIFNERPDVAAKFSGFTYYPNTVSFGQFTNFASPAMYGGYDYTPEMIDARSDELLKDKHNEALLTLPVIFSERGWIVNVGDPSYANYQWIPDLSIYDEYDGINAYHMSGVFNDKMPLLTDAGEELEIRLNRNMFCYGFMKTLPYILQPVAYSYGSYCFLNYNVNNSYIANSSHIQYGLYEKHIQEQLVLDSLVDVIDISQEPDNCFFILSNGSTHDVSLLKEPDYTPAIYVDNTEYDAAHEDRFTVDGVTMHMDTDYCTYAAYQCSMEALISLGKWFDYLRENGLYDNTRIIIVSDHGFGLKQFDDLYVDDLDFDAQSVNPILLVKDFNSSSFKVSEEFMTNADMPSIALEGIVEDPVNPFTNNPINQSNKSGELLIYCSGETSIYINNGTRFVDPDGFWLTVHDNIFVEDNWALYPGEPN